MTPDPIDFLGLEEHLTHEERLVRTAVAQFVKQQVLPLVAECFEAGRFPRDLVPALGKLGVLGMHLRGYGCAGANAVAYGLACMELEAGDTGIRSFVSVQGSLAMFAIYRWGSEDQKNRWLQPMARGECIGCFGLTEADFGSNPAGMRTYARRDGSDWLVRGTKMWISNGSIADVAIVWAQSDEGIRGFVVPTSTKGFSARDVKRKLSLRASVTSELILDDCRLPADALLPAARGLAGPLSCLHEARYGIVWGAIGAARSCYQTAIEYSTSRVQFDRPIAGFQLVQRRLVEMLLEYQKGALLAIHLGRMKDAGRLLPEQVSFGKLNNVRAALEIARSARSVLGGSGITLEYPVMRHMANLESVATYEGTEEIHTLVLGQAITGMSAFT